jgi:hypothetical protein
MKHFWALWVTLSYLSRLPACCKTSNLGRPRFLFRVSFPLTGYLPWLTSPAYPPRNPRKGPLPYATHQASGTWSSRKAGSPVTPNGCAVSCESYNLIRAVSNLQQVTTQSDASCWTHLGISQSVPGLSSQLLCEPFPQQVLFRLRTIRNKPSLRFLFYYINSSRISETCKKITGDFVKLLRVTEDEVISVWLDSYRAISLLLYMQWIILRCVQRIDTFLTIPHRSEAQSDVILPTVGWNCPLRKKMRTTAESNQRKFILKHSL